MPNTAAFGDASWRDRGDSVVYISAIPCKGWVCQDHMPLIYLGTGIMARAFSMKEAILSLACDLAPVSMRSSEQAKAVIDAIAQESKAKWGDEWIAPLVRAYCEIESQEIGLVKPMQRRSQLVRSLEECNPTLETLL